MKRTELKVGDWVSFEGMPFQIYDMTRQGDVIWYDEGALTVLLEDVEPVELSGKDLEKNGWEADKDGSPCYHDGWYCIRKVNPDDDVWMFFHDDDFLTTFRYVHQLQHLLWALGFDDNLKL